MGFGTLLAGYFMTYLMSVSLMGYLIRFMGYAVMLYAFTRLRKYNRAFDLPMYSSVVMLTVTAADVYANVGQFMYDSLIISSFSLPDGYALTLARIDDALVLIFHACLLYAVRKIAKETEVENISYGAARNFAFICVYYLLVAISYLPFEFTEDYKRFFSMPIYLLYFAWIILDVVLIFKCYAKICDEDDVDMPLKKTRFEALNRFREETARREQKAADEAVEYTRQKLEQRRNGRKRK